MGETDVDESDRPLDSPRLNSIEVRPRHVHHPSVLWWPMKYIDRQQYCCYRATYYESAFHSVMM